MTLLEQLIAEYKDGKPAADIWRRYPDITEAEDAQTDTWACEQVSSDFAAFARERGWDAVVVFAEDSPTPFTDYHAWVKLTYSDGTTAAVDWTARQYHNLKQESGHDPAVLNLPWPLVWAPALRGAHPIVGTFRTIKEDQSG